MILLICLIVRAILLSYRIGNCLICSMQMILSFALNQQRIVFDKLEYFCKTWIVSVNLNKTNVLIFNKAGRVVRNLKFH